MGTKISALPAVTTMVDADIVPYDQAGTTSRGTGLIIKTYVSNAPTLVTPTLGVATATSINKVAITAPATSATLTLIDGTTVTGPGVTGTLAILGANTFTALQTLNSAGAVFPGSSSGTATLVAPAAAGTTTVTLPGTTSTLATLGANTFTGAQALGANNITGTGTANRFGTAGTNDTSADTMLTASGSTKRALTLQGSRAAGNADPLFAITDFTAGANVLTVDCYGRQTSLLYAFSSNGLVLPQDLKIGFSSANNSATLSLLTPSVSFANSGSGASRMFIVANDTSTIGAMLQNSGGRQRVVADVTNATTTFGNITGIGFNSSAAGKYTGRLIVKCNNSVAAEGIKFDFNGGTATASAFWAVATQLAGGTVVLGTVIATALNGAMNFTTITGETLIQIDFSMVASGAGTVIPRVAENSTATGTVTVELGSFMWTESTP